MTENVLKCCITLGCPYKLLSLQCHDIIRATKKRKKEQKRRERGFQTAESEGKGKNRSKRLAGYVREHECRAVPVVGKGENILLSLCVSCGRWDGEQLMAFHVITYRYTPTLTPFWPNPFFPCLETLTRSSLISHEVFLHLFLQLSL